MSTTRHSHDTGASSRPARTKALRYRCSGVDRPTGVKVAVADARLDEQFEFDVAGADALAAFYHPFAYAAGRRHQDFGDV